MKLSSTRYILALLAIIVLLVGALYAWLFTEIRDTNTAISSVVNQLDLQVKKDRRLNSIKALIEELGNEIAALDGRFVSHDGVVAFLEELEGLGSFSGASVDVNSVSLQARPGNTPDELLKIEFVSRGRWSSVVQLVSLLETLPFSITFERVQLERVPTQGGLWQANVSFMVAKLK